MEAGRWKGENADLITAMIKGADTSVSDEEMTQIEQCACPGCGSCSGNVYRQLNELTHRGHRSEFCQATERFLLPTGTASSSSKMLHAR